MKRITIALAILMIPSFGFTQKTLKEWSELDEKKWSKQLTFNSYLFNLKRYVESADQEPQLNNIGLLTFYMFTPSPTMKSVNLLSPAQITNSGSDYMADELFNNAYPGLVKGFKEKGITLLELNDYLDTDEKMNLYKSTEFEASAMGKGTASWAAKLSGRAFGGDARATPEGYKLITEANWDIKLMRTIGDFAGKVDIDAVVCVQQQITWDGKSLSFGPLIMSLIGPNPVAENEDDWYAPMGPLKGYLEGFIYGAVIVQPKQYYYLGYAGKKGIDPEFSDLSLIYDRVAQSLVDYVNGEIDQLTKKK